MALEPVLVQDYVMVPCVDTMTPSQAAEVISRLGLESVPASADGLGFGWLFYSDPDPESLFVVVGLTSGEMSLVFSRVVGGEREIVCRSLDPAVLLDSSHYLLAKKKT